MKKIVGLVAFCAGMVALAGDYPIVLPKMGTVRATGGFWAAREATNRLVTARANLQQSERSGRISNFVNAGKKIHGEAHGRFRGTFFNDSDVYKVAEGMAYELAHHPDAADEATLEDLAKKFIWAQEPDGYIYTARTLGDRHERVGNHRWYCDDAHELYCMGHLIEAAVAHYETTGRDHLLKAVCRTADMMRTTFGTGANQIRFLPGHPEVELALCKLYRATGKRAYLELAIGLLGMRGLPKEARVGEVKRGFPNNRPYYQDHKPVREQHEAVGHAVRACYLYAGMCEAGVLADDKGLLEAVDALWNDIVTKKLYLSGGVGARPEIEGFGPAYDLPNDHVCLETCAAIAHALFNQRLFLRSGDAKYLDLIERIAYNGSLCSISIAGDEFFYPNPMASRGGYKRSKWFGCACCPPNVVRFIPQLINWTFAFHAAKNTYYWNFFLTSEADLGRVKFVQTTDYPWNGTMKLVVNPAKDGDVFNLKVRIPGWARGVPTPGGLYTQTKPSRAMEVCLTVNGRAMNGIPGRDGFLTVAGRAWKKGDVVELVLPMEVKRIKADDRVVLDRGRLAVERGPLVYCAEGVDNNGKAFNAVLPPEATFTTEPIEIACTKMVAVKGGGLTLVPFFAWCHRGAGEMQTWFPVSREAASGNSQGIIARASHCWHLDTVEALFDGKLPASSADESIRRFSFWPHLGKTDWIEFELPMRRPVKGVEVYWFDDRHVRRGQCSLPASWKVQSRLFPGLPWTDVKDATYTTVMDGFSTATFPAAIESETFRICVTARPGQSAGVLEVRVKE
ncbi:MAG: glycoside hydrolase family 127 protein [Kiritimatiellae bacterium]|nr:glycoside hydrolase family 127 protein [Kiritimatiellia bacterium]